MHTIKPIDHEIILQAIVDTGKIITIEDHNIVGGLGSAVAEVIAEANRTVMFKRLGLHDFSSGYGTYTQVKEMNGIGVEKIFQERENCYGERAVSVNPYGLYLKLV